MSEHDNQLERFDDDRLLSFALGLEEDAELDAALQTDAALRARLERVEADLHAIEQGVHDMTPAPEADWADLSSERWEGLKPYVSAPPPKHRRGVWMRVLAPAAAVCLVAAVTLGVVLSQHRFAATNATSGGGAMESQVAGGGAASKAAAEESARALDTYGSDGSTQPSAAPDTLTHQNVAVTPSTDTFNIVAVVRAGEIRGGNQTFTVEHMIKGTLEVTVTLATEVGGVVPVGEQRLLYLDPVDSTALAGTSPSTASADQGPSDSLGSGRVLFMYHGEVAVVTILAPHQLPIASSTGF